MRCGSSFEPKELREVSEAVEDDVSQRARAVERPLRNIESSSHPTQPTLEFNGTGAQALEDLLGEEDSVMNPVGT